MVEVHLTKHERSRAKKRATRRLASITVSADVLLELLAVGVATYRGVRGWPFTTVSREQDRAWHDQLREYVRQEQQAILRLKRRRLVEAIATSDGVHYMLTEAGKVEAMRQQILREERELEEGFYCYVSFDIPVHGNAQRDALRSFLKAVGFTLVHYSLWRSRKDVAGALRQLITQCHLERAVTVFVTQELSQ